jgi:hypothetical protein
MRIPESKMRGGGGGGRGGRGGGGGGGGERRKKRKEEKKKEGNVGRNFAHKRPRPREKEYAGWPPKVPNAQGRTRRSLP